MRSTVLLLTTMNEVEGLRSLWERIPFRLFDRVLIVDGDSTDGTLQFLAEKGYNALIQNKPGRGNAIRQAMSQINEDVVVLMASDGNDDPSYVASLLAKIDEGYDLASGSRFMKGGRSDDSDDRVGIRRFGNRFFTFIVDVLWGSDLTDAAYGLRAFRVEAWKKMNINAEKNETEFLMSIRSAKLRLKVCQIPVVEGTRVGGEVKAATLSTGWSLLKVIMREWFNS
jgi:glycosyltransferase involved in cell wall biosynthesis